MNTRPGNHSPTFPCADRLRRAFTLVEVMMATAVGGLVLAALGSMLVMTARMVYKNQQIDTAATNTRLVQEHLNGEMSMAISQTVPATIRPVFTNSSGTTPPRYATITYRVAVGSFSTVYSTTANTSNTLTIVAPADVTPKVGDYVLMDSPNLGSGILIAGVTDSRAAGTSGSVNLTLATTILAGTQSDAGPAEVGKLVRVQRERKYETVAPDPVDSPVTELRWYETTASSDYVVLSRNADASARHLFSQIPEDTSPTVLALEPSVSWQFSYVAGAAANYTPGSRADYFQSNYAEGLIMPKSGNPLSASSISGISTTISTTTTSTTSTTTTSIPTTTSTSSTTSKSTTTSTKSTSTTSKSTTSTTKTTTTKTTSTSTTSKSTTSTTKTTTTSTTSKSTTSTSSKSTSSTSTSKTTSLSTTSKSTTSTSKSTTTSTASTTSKSTSSVSTSKSTTTSTKSTTSTSKTTTTSSIPFDG